MNWICKINIYKDLGKARMIPNTENHQSEDPFDFVPSDTLEDNNMPLDNLTHRQIEISMSPTVKKGSYSPLGKQYDPRSTFRF